MPAIRSAGALAVLDVIDEEQLCARATAIGERMRERLAAMAERFPSIVEVRGLSAMTAVEFRHGGDIERPAGDLAAALKAEAAKRGLLRMCGGYGNVLRVMAPAWPPFQRAAVPAASAQNPDLARD